MHYIKEIFEENKTQHAHNKLIRYSKGEFTGPLIKAKFTTNSIKLFTSFHFIDEILILLANHLGNVKVNIKGSLIWNRDLSVKLQSLGIMYSKVSKARGIFKYTLDNEVKLKDFVELFSNYNLLINFKLENVSVAMKSALPKPNKEITADFCKLTMPKEMENILREEFLFDIREKCKEVEIEHKIIVKDIILPTEEDLDFEMKRRLAKRKGTLYRKITIDSKETLSQINFEL
ncbi:MAG: hypothetical protein ACMXYB_05490 [Candidatus Woesearchaeota archaeon]